MIGSNQKSIFFGLILIISNFFNLSLIHAKDQEGRSRSSNSNIKNYVHSWIPFPTLEVRNLRNMEMVDIKPTKGEALIVIFLASWCLPCQQLIREFQKLEESYENRFSKFIYIFAHDTKADALGFTETYNLKQNVFLGNAKILEKFHQPELPSVYVADRTNWLLMRKINTKLDDIKEIERFLAIHTAL